MSDPTRARSRLAFALDVRHPDEARSWVSRLGSVVGVFKIGLELFIRSGPDTVRMIREAGARCFLDLKLHDIPETVARAVRVASELRVDFLTLHALGGESMLRAAAGAVDANDAARVKLLAVTVLTSLDDRAVSSLGFIERADDLAIRLAKSARVAGVPRVVCSPHGASRGRT